MLGGALVAPLLAQFGTTALGATPDDKWGTISDGWIEIRWTPPAQAQLDRSEATVAAIAPANLIKDQHGMGIRFPVLSGAGDPALTNLSRAQGSGSLDGGLVVRTPTGEVRATRLEATMGGGQVSGKCTVNGIDVGVQSVFDCGLDAGRLAVESAPAGEPIMIRLADVPARPTQEAVDTFASVLGAPGFTTDTVLAYVTAECRYHPPQR
jgi:hypothetical protein